MRAQLTVERGPVPGQGAPATTPDKSDVEAWMIEALPSLERLARRLTNSPADAADLVQATCLRGLEKRTRFIEGAAADFRGWLVTIMWHLHYDALRKRRREVLSTELDELPHADSDPGKTEEPPPWMAVEDRTVEEAVEALPATLHDPYVLFAVDQLTYAAIANRLKMPLRTVGTRIFRARARLRAALQRQAA